MTTHQAKESANFQRRYPGVRVRTFSEAANLLHGLDTPTRDAVEVQLWRDAPAFLASRSSMSEFALLHRYATRGREQQGCSFFMQTLYRNCSFLRGADAGDAGCKAG